MAVSWLWVYASSLGWVGWIFKHISMSFRSIRTSVVTWLGMSYPSSLFLFDVTFIRPTIRPCLSISRDPPRLFKPILSDIELIVAGCMDCLCWPRQQHLSFGRINQSNHKPIKQKTLRKKTYQNPNWKVLFPPQQKTFKNTKALEKHTPIKENRVRMDFDEVKQLYTQYMEPNKIHWKHNLWTTRMMCGGFMDKASWTWTKTKMS